MACSAALTVAKASKQWSLMPGLLQSLRHDEVALDQQLAAQFITCFGQLGDVEAAEAIFLVCATRAWLAPILIVGPTCVP